MGGYLFYSVADKEQDAIFSDTKLRWGELQAERYIRKLHDHLSLLCDNKA
jgi:plasmid stabilization system protein ParE